MIALMTGPAGCTNPTIDFVDDLHVVGKLQPSSPTTLKQQLNRPGSPFKTNLPDYSKSKPTQRDDLFTSSATAVDPTTERMMVVEDDSNQETPVSNPTENWNILCGRCKDSFNNIGNRRFRVTISLNIPKYSAAKNRSEKSVVIKEVTRMLLADVGARFLKQVGDDYVELDEREARSKVGHALRDMNVAQQQLASKALARQSRSKQQIQEQKTLDAKSDASAELPERANKGTHRMSELSFDPLPLHAPSIASGAMRGALVDSIQQILSDDDDEMVGDDLEPLHVLPMSRGTDISPFI